MGKTVLLSESWPMCHIHMSKKLLWLRGLSDGYRDEFDGLFLNRLIARQVQRVGFAQIPFVSGEQAERLVYN